jgi:hypothetical protein
MDPAWREHLEALKRVNEWEDAQLAKKPGDYVRALEWITDAWGLADRLGPAEDPRVRRERHFQEIVALRAALSRADLRA